MSQPPRFELTPKESLGSELTRNLLDYLLSGALAPGDRLLSERALAETLNVSREAIRNAIKSLAILGIVETRVGSGTYFVGRQSDLLPSVIKWGLLLSQDWVMDLIDARYHLEILFAGLAAERCSDDDLAILRGHIAAMQASSNDYAVYAEADAEFHLALARASGNIVLGGVLSNIRSLLSAWSERVIRTAGETETSLLRHEPIVKAVAEGNPDAAREAMKAHMDRAVARLRQSVEDQARSGEVVARASAAASRAI